MPRHVWGQHPPPGLPPLGKDDPGHRVPVDELVLHRLLQHPMEDAGGIVDRLRGEMLHAVHPPLDLVGAQILEVDLPDRLREDVDTQDGLVPDDRVDAQIGAVRLYALGHPCRHGEPGRRLSAFQVALQAGQIRPSLCPGVEVFIMALSVDLRLHHPAPVFPLCDTRHIRPPANRNTQRGP